MASTADAAGAAGLASVAGAAGMGFPFVEASGTPYEIGLAHGRGLRTQVANSIACYRAMFADYSNLEWSRARKLSLRFAPMIEEYNAAYLDEIRGVADGSGFDFEDILALNCRSELVFVGNEMNQIEGACTTIGVSADASSTGRALMGYNWDWKTCQRDAMGVVRIAAHDGLPSILMLTEAGIIGKAGINSDGLCVSLNALSTNQAPAGLPLHIAMRGMLESSTLYEAIRATTRMPLGCCANFMVGSANGEVIDIEVENEDYDVLYPQGGLIVHTNHFTSPRLPLSPRKDTLKSKVPDTFVRLGRAAKLMRRAMDARDGSTTLDDIAAVLHDHVEYPSSICRHDDPKVSEGLRMGTVFSLIAELGTSKMSICVGNPCENTYETYRL